MRQPLTGPGLLATFALLVAACGGGEDGLRDDGSLRVDDDSLRVEAYFEALESVATDLDARGEELVATFLSDVVDLPDPETLAAFLSAWQELFNNARSVVAALTAPRNVAPAHDAFVEAIDAVIDETMAARARAEAGDIGAFFEFSAAFAEFERTCTTLERLAADRGIDVALACVDE
jgi:hypothetical protein